MRLYAAGSLRAVMTEIGAAAAQGEQPSLRVVQVPASLAVGADYGLTVLADAGPQGAAFMRYILSAPAHGILARHGFEPVY